MPDELTVLVDFANAVKGYAMAPALCIYEPEGLRVVFGKTYFPERYNDDPSLHAVEVAQLKVAPPKLRLIFHHLRVGLRRG